MSNTIADLLKNKMVKKAKTVVFKTLELKTVVFTIWVLLFLQFGFCCFYNLGFVVFTIWVLLFLQFGFCCFYNLGFETLTRLRCFTYFQIRRLPHLPLLDGLKQTAQFNWASFKTQSELLYEAWSTSKRCLATKNKNKTKILGVPQ